MKPAWLLVIFVAVSRAQTQAVPWSPPPTVEVRHCTGPATSLPDGLAAAIRPRDPRNYDHQTANLARTVPGGYANRSGDHGQNVIMLVRPESASQAKSALAQQLSWGADWDNAVVRPARWDYDQLVDWKDHLELVMKHTVKGGGGYIDILANRVHLDVSDSTERSRLIAALQTIPVPCDLVQIGLGVPKPYRAR